MKIHSSKYLLLLLAILAIGIPFVIQFEPFFYPSDLSQIWQINIKLEDPVYDLRLSVIFLGIVITLVAFFEMLMTNFQTEDTLIKYQNTVIFIIIFNIGWKNYPYWANGFFYFYPGYLYDPEALLPMTILGEFWHLPILMVDLIGWVLIPVIIYQLIKKYIKNKDYAIKAGSLIALCSLLIYVMLMNPGYYTWYFD